MLAGLAVCLLAPLFGSLAPSNWVWGLDVLASWPWPSATAFLALAAAGFVPPLAKAIERGLGALGASWSRRPLAGDLLLAALVGGFVFALRDPVQFTGDHSLRVGGMATGRPTARLFPQAFPLDVAINIDLPRGLIGMGLDANAAMQLVGAIMAALFTLASLAFVRATGARGAAFPAAAAIVIAGGYLVHFAGYDKFGPMLVGIALAATGVARLARDGRGALLLALGTIVCLLSSRLGYAILPPALLALAAGWRAGRRRGAVLAFAAVLGAAIAMLPRTLEIFASLDRATHVPGGAQAITTGSPDAPDALLRIADAGNLLFMLVPLWPAGLVAAVLMTRSRTAPARGAHSSARLVAGAVVAALLLQIVILVAFRARQGLPRDWDAYAGVALVVALASTAALVALWNRGRSSGVIAPAFTVALAWGAAFFALHASEPRIVHRVETMLNGRPSWSAPAMAAAWDYLGVRALRLGRHDEAARHFDAAIRIAPNPRFFYQAGLGRLASGALDDADSLFGRALARAPGNSDVLVGLAQVALARADTGRGVALLDSALTITPDHPALELRRELRARGR